MATQESISRRTRSKPQQEVRKARVVLNYGDVGITESKYFDILSRFVIVMFEPEYNAIPTYQNANRLFAIVARPRHLWISADGGIQANQSQQLRSDYSGNSNRGVPSSYSINNIPRINRPYSLGEQITIKRLAHPMYFSDSFFSSAFDSSHFDATSCKYEEGYLTRDPAGAQSVSGVAGRWDSARIFPLYPAGGSSLRGAILNGTYYNGAQIASFLNAPLSFPTKSNSGTPQQAPLETYDATKQYGIGIHKFQYEIFIRYLTTVLSTVDTIIAGGAITGYNNNYLWKNIPEASLLSNSCFFEDLNLDGKARIPNNECLPLIVTQPNTFPIPRTRQAGSIKFDPTFSQIVG